MPHNYRRGTANRRPVRSPVRRPPPVVRKPTTRRETLIGTTEAGNPIRFRPEDVRVVRLRSRSGTVRGISFPSKRNDASELMEWMDSADRTADRKYLPDYLTGDAYRPGRFQNSPWRAARSTPFYVHAHADPHAFDITVRTRSGRDVVVGIDGRTHARLIDRNSDFRRSVRRDPNRPVVYMSCESGFPGGNAASRSADYLHSQGRRNTVYAPTGEGVRVYGTTHTYYGVDAARDGGPGRFSTFPPPPGRNN